MSANTRRPEADPLYAEPTPQRAAYATGMLLDARDFADEQTYHRGRLARALAFLAVTHRPLVAAEGEAEVSPGLTVIGGTLAGLKVIHRPADLASPEIPEEIEVAPGVAIDGLGRLVEVQRPACLRLERWFRGEAERDGGDTLLRAAQSDLDRFVSARAEGELPARAVVADVYVRFVACESGLTPSFAAGPFDALDAVSASRVRDAYELHLIARGDGLDDVFTGLPDLGPDLAAIADIDERRARLQDAILGAYPVRDRAGAVDAIEPPAGHPPDLDPTAVFLARVLIPVGASDPPERGDAPVRVDNFSRRFIPAATLLARWLGA